MEAKETHEEAVDVRARRRLRELRKERGLTLQQVAERASIDVSTLSRLESGKRRLALDHIPGLAAALGVSTDALLGSSAPEDPRVRSAPRSHDGLTFWPLTRRGSTGGLLAYKVHISAKRRTPPDELAVHEGHDWLYVLSGRLRLLLGEDDFKIDPGEAVEFTTWTPHWFGAAAVPLS
jgi:transcriptional regulator with XRE-family HTH domain